MDIDTDEFARFAEEDPYADRASQRPITDEVEAPAWRRRVKG